MLLDIYAFHLERAGLIASSKGGLLGRAPLFLKSASEHHNACKAASRAVRALAAKTR